MDIHHGAERRRHPRICEAFPVIVRAVDASGNAFKLTTVLDNFSSHGLSVRLVRRVAPGTKVFAVIRLSTAPDGEVRAARVAVHGDVLRAEPQPDGSYRVAVQFTWHHFL